MYYIDIYVVKPRHWMKRYDLSSIEGKYGVYYRIKTDNEAVRKKITRKLRFHNIKHRVYDSNYTRSSSYRKKFIEAYPPPYRCAYCGRFLTLNKMQVDHVIPVNKAKSSPKARRILKKKGIQNVNDLKNLVPSCSRCNEKKGTKMGWWVVKGYFWNKFPIYMIDWFVKLLLFVLVIWIIYYAYHNNPLVHDVINYIISLIN